VRLKQLAGDDGMTPCSRLPAWEKKWGGKEKKSQLEFQIPLLALFGKEKKSQWLPACQCRLEFRSGGPAWAINAPDKRFVLRAAWEYSSSMQVDR